MVDLFRLLKKAFIANKQGFKEFGSEKEEQQKKQPEIKDPRVKSFFSVQREKPKPEPRQSVSSPSGRGFSLPSFNAPSLPKIPAATGVYIGLIILSIIGLILKTYIAYHPGGSLFLSIILGFFFFIAIHYTPEAKLKKSLVIITFALDTFAQFFLGLIPESGIRDKVIAYYVFAWLILAVVLFLMGIFDTMGAGERLGKGGLFVLMLLIGFVLFLLFPILITGPDAKQNQTHAEYYGIAVTQVGKIGKTLAETKNVWHDYFTCTFGVLGGSYKYDSCIDDKKIFRYCKNNFAATKEQEECFKQQKELLAQGARPGVAGSVSEAIKEITKVELKVDEYFPKKTIGVRKSYPVTLSIQNPREQTFTARVSCLFKKGKEEAQGKIFIYGEERSEVQLGAFSGEYQVPIECQPTADLNGRYTLEYSAVLSGMQTFSFLKRAFISKGTDKTIREQVEADNFKTRGDRESQGPKEFALLNFKFGTGDGTQPLVLVEEPVTFSFTVADIILTGGEVLKVNSYSFSGLLERGFSVDETKIGDKDCLQGGEIFLSSALTKKREPSELKRCFLLLPPDLKSLTDNDFKVETFVADLNYDYKITQSVPLEVTPLVAPELVS